MAPKKPEKNSTINGKKRRNNKNSFRNRQRESVSKGKDESVMEQREGGNNPRWYGSEKYVQSVGQFNFSSPLGRAMHWSFRNDPQSGVSWSMASNRTLETIPGVMAINILPTLGVTSSAVDPMNTYIQAFYSKLRSTNNQSAPYAAPDLGIYILAVDSIHIMLSHLIRAYGVARTYNIMNKYYPVAVLRAMGIEANNVTYPMFSNLADVRARILQLMVKAQTIAIPKGINYNERHRELFKYVYSDGTTSKAQTYLFRPAYVYKFKETYSQQGGGLEATPTPNNASIANWLTLTEDLIDAVRQSQSNNIISGDIVKSFGYEELYTMEYFEPEYTVVPVYNPEILLEIHNAKVCGDRYDATAFDVYQDANTNSLISAPYCKPTKAPAGPVDCIIDVPVDTPSPDIVMVATRLATTGAVGYITASSGGHYKFVPDTLGSEMVVSLAFYYLMTDGTIGVSTTDTNVVDETSATSLFTVMKESFFDWHPHMYYIDADSNHNGLFHGVISELSNYTIMSVGDLMNLHQVAMYGLLTAVKIDNVGLQR